MSEQTKCLGDPGYQGLAKEHANAQALTKKLKGAELTKEQKQANRELAKQKIMVENGIRHLKIFRACGGEVSESPSLLWFAFNLIADLYNFELNL